MKTFAAIPALAILIFALIATPAVQGASSGQKKSSSNCVTLTIDYSIKPAEMGKGDRVYGSVIYRIGTKLKPRGKGKVVKEVCWFKLDKKTATKQAIKRIEVKGFLAADLWELHALRLNKSKGPKLGGIDVVALGSIFPSDHGGILTCPALHEQDSVRRLDMIALQKPWNVSYLFAAVRK